MSEMDRLVVEITGQFVLNSQDGLSLEIDQSIFEEVSGTSMFIGKDLPPQVIKPKDATTRGLADSVKSGQSVTMATNAGSYGLGLMTGGDSLAEMAQQSGNDVDSCTFSATSNNMMGNTNDANS